MQTRPGGASWAKRTKGGNNDQPNTNRPVEDAFRKVMVHVAHIIDAMFNGAYPYAVRRE